jgi:mycofactocin precursor
MNPKVEHQDQQTELATEDLIEEVSIDGMCGVY